VRNAIVGYSALSELHGLLFFDPGATRLAALGACPWLSYLAPSALSINSPLTRGAIYPWCRLLAREFFDLVGQGRDGEGCGGFGAR
jgi:hypothetical protein